MRQVEVSPTMVLDDPRRARSFFEALVTDNVGIGRPEQVHAVFGRDRRGRTTSKQFRTARRLAPQRTRDCRCSKVWSPMTRRCVRSSTPSTLC